MKANAKDGSLEMNKTAMALKNIAGIDVMKDHKTGELKDMVSVLDELHGKWGDLTDAQQKGLSEAIAGKHQAAIFQSLMGNYETFKKMRNEFSSGMHFGSAERENEQYLNSLAGKLNKLKTTSLDTFSTIFNSSEAYSLLDVINKIAEGINKVTHSLSDMHMLSPAIGGIIGGIKGFKNYKGQLGLKTARSELIDSLKAFTGKSDDELKSMGITIEGNSEKTKGFGKALKGLKNGLKESGKIGASAWRESEKGLTGAGKALKSFKNSSKGLFKDFGLTVMPDVKEGLTGVLKGAAQGLAIGAVMSGVQIVISKASDYMNRHKIAFDEGLDKQQSLQQSISDLKTQQAGIKELSVEYDSLAKKTNKTAEETKRFSELKNEIAQIAPDLKIGTDQNNDPILRMSGSAEGYAEILQKDIDLKEQLLGMNQGSLANEAFEIAKDSMSDFKDDFRAVDRVMSVFEGNQKSFDFLFGNSDFGTMLRERNVRKAAEDFEVARASAQERYEQMSMLNAEMSKDAITKLQNPNMYKNYALATDSIKDQINAFASSKVNWSNLGKATDKSKAISLFDKMALASKKGTLNISSLNRELEDMQENFNASGNEKVYEKRLDDVSETIAKATGTHKDFVKEMLRTPRYNMDWDTQNLAKYMESQGVKYTNLGSKDEKVRANARNIKAQYESLKGIWDSISQEDITTEFTTDILMNRNIPPDMKGLASKFLLDGEISDQEANILYNLGIAYENGMTESQKKLLEDGEALRNKENREYRPEAAPLNEVFSGMLQGAKDILSGKAFSELGKEIEAKFKVKPSIEWVTGGLGWLVDNGLSWLDEFFGGHGDRGGQVGGGETIEKHFSVKPVIDWVTGIGDGITDFINSLFGGSWSGDSGTIEKHFSVKPIIDWVSGIGDGITDFINSLFGGSWGGETETIEKHISIKPIIDIVTGFNDGLTSIINKLFGGSWGGETETVEKHISIKPIIDWVSGIGDSITDFINGLFGGSWGGKSGGETETVEKEVVVNPKLTVGTLNLGNIWEQIKSMLGFGGEGSEEHVEKKVVVDPKLTVKKLDIGSIWEQIKAMLGFGGEGSEEHVEKKVVVDAKPEVKKPNMPDILGWIKKVLGGDSGSEEHVEKKIVVDPKTEMKPITLDQIKGEIDKAKKYLSSLTSDLGGKGGKPNNIKITADTKGAEGKIKDLIGSLKGFGKKAYKITIEAVTAKAYGKIKAFTSQMKGISKKTLHMSVVAHTAHAFGKISALTAKAKSWAGKTFHASFIAHTAHAHSKISALLSKARQWNGHTFHASFIAHTAHAYAKVSSLLSLAQSFGGRTFHASMTVTKTINTIHKGKRPGKGATTKSLSEPIALNEQANTPMVASDTPTVLADEPIRPIVRTGASTPALFGLPYTGNGSIQDAIGGISDSIGGSLKDVENKVIQTIHGIQSKAISLADAVKNGTIVTLTPITKTVKDILDCLKFDIDRLKELENAIKKVSNVIDYTDKKLQHSVGSGRIALLQKENNLLVERLKLNEQMIAQKKRERDIYKTELKKKGLKFGEDGNIKNYEETMLKYKRELEKLEKSEEKASDSSSKKNEKRKKELEEIIKMMEKFLELVFTEIPDLDSRKLDDSNKYQDNLLEINKINHEKWVVEMESHWKNINKEVQKLTNKLDMLDVKMKHAWGSDKLQMMNQQIEILKQSQSAYQNNLNALKHAQGEIQDKLKNYGFKFKANGDIEDFVATMNKLKDSSEEFDTIQKLVDGYFQVYLEDIPKAERELAEFQNKIKDVYKEQLEATKALEDQIIEMYKKELEEKKKMIDEELDHKLDALEKEKKAYDRMREEQKYNDDFNEQADKVKELEKQIEYAQKDTTLVGQKRLKTLLKQLEEEKKKLDKITQDRIDKQVGDSFDDEKDRLEDKAETEKKDLDEKYTDQELLEMAQNAIKNGMFVGIDGEVKSLQDALVEYINKWGDGLSATGAIIKSELITKLEIATQIAKEYSDVLGNLGVGSLDQNNIYGKGGKDSIPKVRNTTSSINYNAPLVNIAGDVTDNNIGQIREIAESVVRENNQRIIDNI